MFPKQSFIGGNKTSKNFDTDNEKCKLFQRITNLQCNKTVSSNPKNGNFLYSNIFFNFWYIITKEKCINKNERVCMCNYSNVVVEITKDHALFEKCLKLIENWYGALT